MPESLSSSWMSAAGSCLAVDLVLARAVAKHPAGDRHLPEYSIGRALSELSMVSVTSARGPVGPRGGAGEMTSSILPPQVLAPCSPMTQLLGRRRRWIFPEPFGAGPRR